MRKQLGPFSSHQVVPREVAWASTRPDCQALATVFRQDVTKDQPRSVGHLEGSSRPGPLGILGSDVSMCLGALVCAHDGGLRPREGWPVA
jgi:hypothetical protein